VSRVIVGDVIALCVSPSESDLEMIALWLVSLIEEVECASLSIIMFQFLSSCFSSNHAISKSLN
jgi:hypothetical protein